MTTKQETAPPTRVGHDESAKLREQYGCGPVHFTGTDNALYERHCIFDNVVRLDAAGPRERFEAFARSVRDVLSQRWVRHRRHLRSARTPSASTISRWSFSSAARWPTT